MSLTANGGRFTKSAGQTIHMARRLESGVQKPTDSRVSVHDTEPWGHYALELVPTCNTLHVMISVPHPTSHQCASLTIERQWLIYRGKGEDTPLMVLSLRKWVR
jgi:hypothetical protein